MHRSANLCGRRTRRPPIQTKTIRPKFLQYIEYTRSAAVLIAIPSTAFLPAPRLVGFEVGPEWTTAWSRGCRIVTESVEIFEEERKGNDRSLLDFQLSVGSVYDLNDAPPLLLSLSQTVMGGCSLEDRSSTDPLRSFGTNRVWITVSTTIHVLLHSYSYFVRKHRAAAFPITAVRRRQVS